MVAKPKSNSSIREGRTLIRPTHLSTFYTTSSQHLLRKTLQMPQSQKGSVKALGQAESGACSPTCAHTPLALCHLLHAGAGVNALSLDAWVPKFCCPLHPTRAGCSGLSWMLSGLAVLDRSELSVLEGWLC